MPLIKKQNKSLKSKLITITVISVIIAIIAVLIFIAIQNNATSQSNNQTPQETPSQSETPLPAITQDGAKPTDATTGPRIATTNRAGGTVSNGTYEGVRFQGDVEIPAGADDVTLRDCVIDGELSIRSTNLVTIEHCEINGWFGHRTNNTDKEKQLLVVRNSKFNGPENNDAVRFGNTVKWGDNSTYQNVLVEDSIFYSPFSSTDPSAHFDLMQFGGGNNYTFNRVSLQFIKDSPAGVGVAYINNDTQNGNVVFNNLWVEGGAVTYVFRGPLTVNTCSVESSTAKYGYTGGSTKAVLNGCVNERGEAF